MERWQLPPELDNWNAFGVRPAGEPSPALRQRVLGGMRCELYAEHVLPKWQIAAAFAATVLWR